MDVEIFRREGWRRREYLPLCCIKRCFDRIFWIVIRLTGQNMWGKIDINS